MMGIISGNQLSPQIAKKLTAKLGSVRLRALSLTHGDFDIEKLFKNCLEILKNWTYKL